LAARGFDGSPTPDGSEYYWDGRPGWFNYGRADGSPFHETITEGEKFFTELGYIKGE